MKPDCELNTQVRIKFTVSEDFHSNSVDLTDPEAPQQIIDKVVSQTGRFDVLVNNAGIMKEATAEHTTLEDWQGDNSCKSHCTVSTDQVCPVASA